MIVISVFTSFFIIKTCVVKSSSIENKTLPSKDDDRLSAWSLPASYDNNMEPWTYRNQSNLDLPWNYDFIFSIIEIEKVDDKERTVYLSMYFIIKWLEPRIIINESAPDWYDHTKSNWSFVPIDYRDRFWYPDLDIHQMKKFEIKRVFKDMASLKVNKTKWLRYSARVDIALSCHMTFEEYPLDSQECPFRVGSYYSQMDIVTCTSEHRYDSATQSMLHHKIDIQPLPSKLLVFDWGGQKWATCGFNISLHRTRVQNIFEVYLTCTLLVIVSWISFIIPPSVVPGRMGLLVITFLTLINMFIEVKHTAPISGGLNAFDIFLIMCIGQVFAACLEYAVVMKKSSFTENVSPSQLRKPEAGQYPISRETQQKQKHTKKVDLDGWSLMLFPLAFVFMVSVYAFIFF